jgi:hypothetical protein
MTITRSLQLNWMELVVNLLFSIGLFILFAAICGLMVYLINKNLRVKQIREHKISIRNEANFPSTFSFFVKSDQANLTYQFFENQIPLPIISPSQSLQLTPLQEDKPIIATVNPNLMPTQSKRSNALQILSKGGRTITSKLGVLASIAGTLGSLLPGSIGSKFSSQSEALRQTQSNVQSTVQAPVIASQKVQSLNQQTGTILNVQGHSTTQATTAESTMVSTKIMAFDQDVQSEEIKLDFPITVETPLIQPREETTITLRIEGKTKVDPKIAYRYILCSEQIPSQSLLIGKSLVETQGVVHFPKVSIWRSGLSPLAMILVIVGCTYAFFYFLGFVW